MSINKTTVSGFFPVYIVKDLDGVKPFYTQHFDFRVVFEADWYIHLISEQGTQFGFMIQNHDSQPEMFWKAYDGEGIIYSIEVNDAKSEYEKFKKSTVPILLELKDEEWGQRHFVIEDPNGMKIDIVQHIEPTEEYKEQYQ